MAARTRGGESDVFGALAAIRPLEFYMPVVKHRESWTGKGDILVVSQLDESAPIVAFDERGREVSLDRKVAPEQPTLSIVPVETRFDQPIASGGVAQRSRSGWKRDWHARADGTQRIQPYCLRRSGGAGGGKHRAPSTFAPGLYLEYSRILDMKEPWFRGDPEIEVHIQGPTDAANPRYGADLSCSGEHPYDFRKVFDQNTGFWEGHVMLFSADEATAFADKFNQGFHVLFWEDDNEPCVLKLDTNSLVELLKSTANAFSTVAIKVFPRASPLVMAGVFLGTLFSNAGPWLLTNDDFLGAAVDQASAGYSYPGNTHVIMDGTTLNGRATIVYRQ